MLDWSRQYAQARRVFVFLDFPVHLSKYCVPLLSRICEQGFLQTRVSTQALCACFLEGGGLIVLFLLLLNPSWQFYVIWRLRTVKPICFPGYFQAGYSLLPDWEDLWLVPCVNKQLPVQAFVEKLEVKPAGVTPQLHTSCPPHAHAELLLTYLESLEKPKSWRPSQKKWLCFTCWHTLLGETQSFLWAAVRPFYFLWNYLGQTGVACRIQTSRDSRLERDILSSHSVQGQVAGLKGKSSGVVPWSCFCTPTAIHVRMFAHHQYGVHVRPLQVPWQRKRLPSTEAPDLVVLCALGLLMWSDKEAAQYIYVYNQGFTQPAASLFSLELISGCPCHKPDPVLKGIILTRWLACALLWNAWSLCGETLLFKQYCCSPGFA